MKQHEVCARHKDQVVEELLSFSSSALTDISPMKSENCGAQQWSITRPFDMTSGITDARDSTNTNFEVF